MSKPWESLPDPLKPDPVEYFNAFARYYDAELAEQGIPAKEEALIKRAVEQAGPENIHSALDLGAGTGIVVGAIQKYAAPSRIVAVDPSTAMLWNLRHKYPSKEVAAVEDSLQDYVGRTEETFDLITCVAVLEFLDDAPEAITNAGRLLNPGGTLAFTYVPRGDHETREKFVDDSESLIQRTVLEYRWLPEEIESSITASGLTIIDRVDGVRTQEYSAETHTAERNYNFVVAARP